MHLRNSHHFLHALTAAHQMASESTAVLEAPVRIDQSLLPGNVANIETAEAAEACIVKMLFVIVFK